jgi:ribosomal protein S27AE
MSERTTAESREIVYEIDSCSNCGSEVFIDDTQPNVDNLPEGINVVIGGGDHMAVEKTGRVARSKDHRVPEILIKLFTDDGESPPLDDRYLCPQCADSIYGYQTGGN